MSEHLKKFDFSGSQPAFDDADALGTDGNFGRVGDTRLEHPTKMVDYWINKATGKYWPFLDKEKVRAGLKERIQTPDAINQSATSLCGVATFVRELAHDDPTQYALLGALLYEGGWGNLGRRGLTRVEPRAATRMEKVPVDSNGNEMNHADWLVLASVRDAFNAEAYRNDFLEGLRGMTVGSMPAFFRTAGYDQLAYDYSATSTKGIDNMEKASDLFRSGYAVALFVHSSLLNDDSRVLPTANHWIALRSPIDVNRVWKPGIVGVKVDRVWTWGGVQSVPKQGDSYIPIQKFIDHYYGYVAAKAHVNGR
jgi:hypothetical protein